jgi:hypothetical protein
MDRNSTKDRNLFGANGSQARELTDGELEAVSGGLLSSVLKKRDDAGNAVIGKM